MRYRILYAIRGEEKEAKYEAKEAKRKYDINAWVEFSPTSHAYLTVFMNTEDEKEARKMFDFYKRKGIEVYFSKKEI